MTGVKVAAAVPMLGHRRRGPAAVRVTGVRDARFLHRTGAECVEVNGAYYIESTQPSIGLAVDWVYATVENSSEACARERSWRSNVRGIKPAG